MSDPEQIIKAFGERMGFSRLSFSATGNISLQTETHRLILERGENEILVYLTEPLGFEPAVKLLQAYKQAHFSNHGEWPVQIAIREREGTPHLLVLTRITEEEFTELRLERTFEYLLRWMQGLQET